MNESILGQSRFNSQIDMRENECSVCMSQMMNHWRPLTDVDRDGACVHNFCKDCLQELISSRGNCPLCNRIIKGKQPNSLATFLLQSFITVDRKIGEKTTEVKNVTKLLDDAKAKLDETQGDLASANAIVRATKDKIESQQAKNAEMQAKFGETLQDLTEKQRRATKERDELSAECVRLQEELATLKRTSVDGASKQRDENESLRRELEQLRRQKQKLESDVGSLQSMVDAEIGKRTLLEKTLRAASDELRVARSNAVIEHLTPQKKPPPSSSSSSSSSSTPPTTPSTPHQPTRPVDSPATPSSNTTSTTSSTTASSSETGIIGKLVATFFSPTAKVVPGFVSELTRYQIGAKRGAKSTTTVYRALDKESKSDVALKTLTDVF